VVATRFTVFEREQFAWRPIQTKFKGEGQQGPPHTVTHTVSGFARLLPVIYTSSSLSKRLRPSGAAIFHAQAHIPAQPSSPLEDARISNADEDQGGRAVISRRRAKGRKRVSVKPGFRE